MTETTEIELPQCPESFSSDLTSPLEEFAKAWAQSDECPSPSQEIQKEWDVLIEKWIEDEQLPLLVRRSRRRGHTIDHKSGRTIVPADNSPSTWAYGLALQENCPNIEDLRSTFENDEIPIAFAQRSEERREAKYERTLSSRENLNKAGWKLAHIRPIGLGRTDVSTLDSEVLVDHFRDFLSPSNMFLIPKKWSGLGEIPEVIEKMSQIVEAER